MSRPVGAHLEGELLERYEEAEEASPEKNKSAFLRSLIVDGLDAKERDVLDAIDASDELREAVETRRKEGEALDDAARRLLREGVDAAEDRSLRSRIEEAVGLGVVSAFPLAISQLYGVGSGYLFVAALLLAVFFEERIPEVSAWVRSLVRA